VILPAGARAPCTAAYPDHATMSKAWEHAAGGEVDGCRLEASQVTPQKLQ
jgi:hypothetical protein